MYVGGHHSLYALDAATGDTLWTYEVKGLIEGSPLVEDSVVYFGATDGYLYALSIGPGHPDEPPPHANTPFPELIHLKYPKAAEIGSRRGWGLGPVAVAVSADGSTMVLGDPVVSTSRTYAGAALVFTKRASSWADVDHEDVAVLLPPERPDWKGLEPRDYLDVSESFGGAVAVSGDGGVVVVGAPEHRPPGHGHGAVYVFISPDGGWDQEPEVVTLLPDPGEG